MGSLGRVLASGLGIIKLSSTLQKPPKSMPSPRALSIVFEKENLGIVLKDHNLFVFIFTELRTHTQSSYGYDLDLTSGHRVHVCLY